MTDNPKTETQAPGGMPDSGGIPDAGGTDSTTSGGVMPPADEKADDASLKNALRVEREARRKAEDDLKKLRDAQKSGSAEAEALSQRLAELEKAKADAEESAMRLRVATETGLPIELSARLFGTDEKSLREDAEALLRHFPKAQPPQPSTSVGGPQGAPTATRSPEDWVTYLRARRG